MAVNLTFRFVDNKVIIQLRDRVCDTTDELIASRLFSEVVTHFVNNLKRKQAPLLQLFGKPANEIGNTDTQELIQVFEILVKMPLQAVPKLIKTGGQITCGSFFITRFYRGFVQLLAAV